MRAARAELFVRGAVLFVRGAGLVIAGAALLLAGCGPGEREVETRHRFMAMGTLVEVTTWGVPQDEGEAAARAVEELFHKLHLAWHPRGEGALGELNRSLAADGQARPDPDLEPLLRRAAALSRVSSGLFQPAMGRLVALWGFSAEDTVPEAPPPASAVRAWLEDAVTLPALLQDDGSLAGPAGVQLDLGGFFKGVAVDRGVELLRARGIEHAIVNAGGDLRAIGRRGERPWRIGIRDADDPATAAAALEIEDDEAVFTSGDYERFFDHQGERYHHVLDPRSGYPAEGIRSVTVLHHDAGWADAAATALMVAGPRDWPAVAAAMDLEAVLVFLDDGDVELTPAMAPRAWFTDEAQGGAARVRTLP